MTDGRSRAAVEKVEDAADGLISDEELSLARSEAEAACVPGDSPVAGARRAAFGAAFDSPFAVNHQLMHGNRASDRRKQAAILLDIFGNPFRPVAADPSWLTSPVLALARQMYEARDFAPIPILADALQDAGCDQPDVLAHCRGAGPHVRGCWVVDLLLGKA